MYVYKKKCDEEYYINIIRSTQQAYMMQNQQRQNYLYNHPPQQYYNNTYPGPMNNLNNNSYPNNQTFNPSQNTYPPQMPNNNYNPNQNMYNQQKQNYQNQQNQNQGPIAFIEGYIGRCKISSEDLQTFSKSLKAVEWTSNATYLQANNIPVKHKLQGQDNRNDVYQPMSNFNNFYENFDFNVNEMTAFINEIGDKNKKFKDNLDIEKSNFMKNNFPSESADLAINELYQKMVDKRKDILSKDNNLYGKVERLLPLIKKAE